MLDGFIRANRDLVVPTSKPPRSASRGCAATRECRHSKRRRIRARLRCPARGAAPTSAARGHRDGHGAGRRRRQHVARGDARDIAALGPGSRGESCAGRVVLTDRMGCLKDTRGWNSSSNRPACLARRDLTLLPTYNMVEWCTGRPLPLARCDHRSGGAELPVELRSLSWMINSESRRPWEAFPRGPLAPLPRHPGQFDANMFRHPALLAKMALTFDRSAAAVRSHRHELRLARARAHGSWDRLRLLGRRAPRLARGGHSDRARPSSTGPACRQAEPATRSARAARRRDPYKRVRRRPARKGIPATDAGSHCRQLSYRAGVTPQDQQQCRYRL